MIFGAGLFQEPIKIKISEVSYTTTDPKINVPSLRRRTNRLRVVPYNVSANVSKQMAAITRSPFLCVSQAFIIT